MPKLHHISLDTNLNRIKQAGITYAILMPLERCNKLLGSLQLVLVDDVPQRCGCIVAAESGYSIPFDG